MKATKSMHIHAVKYIHCSNSMHCCNDQHLAKIEGKHLIEKFHILYRPNNKLYKAAHITIESINIAVTHQL